MNINDAGLTNSPDRLLELTRDVEHLKKLVALWADNTFVHHLAAELLAVREAQSLSAGTQFKPVADLYEMQFEDGQTIAFQTEAEKAIQWLNTCDGNKVQEYVKLERLQEAFTAPPAPAVQDEVKQVLLWALWHHQGGNSDIGQPIRQFLGIDQYSRLTSAQLDIAKAYPASMAEKRVIRDGCKLVPIDLINDLRNAAHFEKASYAASFGSHIDTGRWKDEYEQLTATCKAVDDLLAAAHTPTK